MLYLHNQSLDEKQQIYKNNNNNFWSYHTVYTIEHSLPISHHSMNKWCTFINILIGTSIQSLKVKMNEGSLKIMQIKKEFIIKITLNRMYHILPLNSQTDWNCVKNIVNSDSFNDFITHKQFSLQKIIQITQIF